MLNHAREIILGVIALTLIAIISSMWFTIDATERGVVLRLGALFRTAPPGLGFKIPLLDSVANISVQTNTYHWEMNTYSSDQQSADLHASVTLHAAPDQVAELYRRFQGLEQLVKRAVDPIVKQQVKVVFGQYTAVRAIQERADLNSEIMRAITSALKDESSVVIENVQIENIHYLALDHLRHERVQGRALVSKDQAPPLEQIASVCPGPDQSAIAREALEQLVEALGTLSERRREILILPKLHQWSYQRIAAHFAISKSGVQKHVRAALAVCLTPATGKKA